MTGTTWSLVHSRAADAEWTPSLREIFDYRDLGIRWWCLSLKFGRVEP